MTMLLCSHKDCPISRDVLIPLTSIIHPTWYCEEHRGHTQFLAKRGSETYRDCAFCKDVVAYGAESRHSDGQLFHVDCLIRMLKDKITDLKNPLTGEEEDDSIPRAFKKIRSALREQARISNKIAYERPLSNSWYGTDRHPQSGMYRDQVGVTWGDVQEMEGKAVRDAIKELERLTA